MAPMPTVSTLLPISFALYPALMLTITDCVLDRHQRQC